MSTKLNLNARRLRALFNKISLAFGSTRGNSCWLDGLLQQHCLEDGMCVHIYISVLACAFCICRLKATGFHGQPCNLDAALGSCCQQSFVGCLHRPGHMEHIFANAAKPSCPEMLSKCEKIPFWLQLLFQRAGLSVASVPLCWDPAGRGTSSEHALVLWLFVSKS